jgi:hypothetical protein
MEGPPPGGVEAVYAAKVLRPHLIRAARDVIPLWRANRSPAIQKLFARWALEGLVQTDADLIRLVTELASTKPRTTEGVEAISTLASQLALEPEPGGSVGTDDEHRGPASIRDAKRNGPQREV